MQRWLVVGLLTALGAMLVAGCGGGGGADLDADTVQPERPAPEVVLDAEDDGSEVVLEVGQALLVRLASNPTTGYGWQVAEGTGAVLTQAGEPLYQQAPQEGELMVGVGGTETFRFEAQGAGQTTLRLEYRRPWEEGVDPEETFAVEVMVR